MYCRSELLWHSKTSQLGVFIYKNGTFTVPIEHLCRHSVQKRNEIMTGANPITLFYSLTNNISVFLPIVMAIA